MIRGQKAIVEERLRCCVRRRERAGLAGPRSQQGTIRAALKAPLFHGSRCFGSGRQSGSDCGTKSALFRNL